MKSVTRSPKSTITRSPNAALWFFNNLEYIGHTDSRQASALVNAGGSTRTAYSSDFGFNIPTTALIKGIEVTLNGQTSTDVGTIDRCQIIYSAKHNASSYSIGNGYGKTFTGTKADAVVGSPTEMFGLAGVLTPTIVNSSYFGVDFGIGVTVASYVYLDNVSITIYYEDGPASLVDEKSYIVKVYSTTGAYLTDITEFTNDISFSKEINTAGSQLVLKLARNPGDYGEGTDIDFGYKVDVVCIDKEEPLGRVVFSGYISSYTPVFSDNSVEVTILSYGDELNKFMLQEYKEASSDGDTYWAVKGTPLGTFPDATGTTLLRIFTVPASCTQILEIYINALPLYYTVYTGVFNLKRGSTIIATAPAIAPGSIGYFVVAFPSPVDVVVGESLSLEIVFDTLRSPQYMAYGNSGDANVGYKLWLPNGTTEIVYSSQDPGAILRDIIDKYRQQGGTLNYDDATVELAGTTVSYTFNSNTILEGIEKCLELAPANWYWYVDLGTNLIHFHEQAVEPEIYFSIGEDLIDAKFEKRIESLVNTVYFTGGGSPALYRKYTNDESIIKYGIKATKYIDQRVTNVATAETIANTILNNHGAPELRVTLDVIDSNAGDNIGFDIESTEVGQVVAVRNITERIALSSWDTARWDSDYWDFNIYVLSSLLMQIRRIDYSGDKITILASTMPLDISKRIEDINRNLEVTQTSTNPAAPS